VACSTCQCLILEVTLVSGVQHMSVILEVRLASGVQHMSVCDIRRVVSGVQHCQSMILEKWSVACRNSLCAIKGESGQRRGAHVSV
jgi:hypothetical protein